VALLKSSRKRSWPTGGAGLGVALGDALTEGLGATLGVGLGVGLGVRLGVGLGVGGGSRDGLSLGLGGARALAEAAPLPSGAGSTTGSLAQAAASRTLAMAAAAIAPSDLRVLTIPGILRCRSDSSAVGG